MKRKFALILCVFIVTLFPVHAWASLPRIVDHADLLTPDEEAYLENIASQLADTYQMDVIIVTVDSLDGKSSESYADDYFDDNGYGIGSDYSGVLFLLSMEYRDWAISTCGKTIYALTDYGIQQVFSATAGYLSEDRYFEAFEVYLDALEPYFSAYADGSPIDGNPGDYDGPGTFIPGTAEDIIYYDEPYVRGFGWYIKKFLIALLVGVVSAAIVLVIMRSKMNTARSQRDAARYVNGGSAQITKHQDIFLYSRVQKTRKQQSSSSGGGSSVHRSSGGRSHGGGHGKF